MGDPLLVCLYRVAFRFVYTLANKTFLGRAGATEAPCLLAALCG